MLKLISFYFIFHMFFVVNVYAQGIIVQIQDKYDKIDSITAKYTQILLHKESGTEEKREGILLFKKPLLVNMETIKPSPEFLIITNKEVWNYLPDEEIAYKYPLDIVYDSSSLIQVVTGQARLDKDFTVGEDGVQNNLLKLVLLPKEPTTQMVEAEIWVDQKSKLIRKASIIDFYGNINSLDFVEISIDKKISESKFIFKPPKGVEIEVNTN